jgi:hypothetical protein
MIDFLRQLNGTMYAEFLLISVRCRTQTANSGRLAPDLLKVLPRTGQELRGAWMGFVNAHANVMTDRTDPD